MSFNLYLITAHFGYHGYDNNRKEMQALMVAAGPNLANLKEVQVIDQVDIYPLICGILGLDHPNKIDGNLSRVAHIITPQPSAEFIDTFMRHAGGGSHRLIATKIVVCVVLFVLFAISSM